MTSGDLTFDITNKKITEVVLPLFSNAAYRVSLRSPGAKFEYGGGGTSRRPGGGIFAPIQSFCLLGLRGAPTSRVILRPSFSLFAIYLKLLR